MADAPEEKKLEQTETKPETSSAPGAPEAASAAPATALAPAAPAAAAPALPTPPAPKPAAKPWECELTQRLKHVYGSGLRDAAEYVGQKYIAVDGSIAHEVLRILHDDEGYDMLSDLTCVHWPKDERPFEVVWILYCFAKNTYVRVKARYAEGEEAPTATNLWPGANWMEREVFDMFGLRFAGHPDLRRILLPEDWQGHPLRKDYDIRQQDNEWVRKNLGIESGQ